MARRMASWLVKAAAQGALAAVPGGDRVNLVLQRRVTGTMTLTRGSFEAKVVHARRHLRRRRRVLAGDAPPAAVLELGTGWHPIVPVAMALTGVERVVTFDVVPLADAERTRAVLERFRAAHESGRLAQLLPYADSERLEALRATAHAPGDDPAGLLAPLGVELRVGDAAATGMPAGSFDLFVSSNTLEHVPPGELRALLGEFHRLGRRRAVMDHFIDMRDHYARFDPAIGRLNYLRYPDGVWRLFNNRLQYQNRLRLPDYRALIRDAGFGVRAIRRVRGDRGEFDELRLARRFVRDYDRDEALVLAAWITAVRRPRRRGARPRTPGR
jgi:hypothetical protein